VFRCNDVPYRYIRKGILIKSCVMLRTYSGKKTRFGSQERLLVKKKYLVQVCTSFCIVERGVKVKVYIVKVTVK
jgi:hypothetical protein